jgi:hypothetical protein
MRLSVATPCIGQAGSNLGPGLLTTRQVQPLSLAIGEPGLSSSKSIMMEGPLKLNSTAFAEMSVSLAAFRSVSSCSKF